MHKNPNERGWGIRHSINISILREHIKTPFFNNAYSLIGIQVATSLLGFLFWTLAARVFTSDEVGLGTGIYSAALLLVGLASLGFGDGITYYLPRVDHPRSLINAYFSVSAIAVLGLSIIFILGQGNWLPELGIIRETPLTILIFIASVLILHISTMQDALFIADGRSSYSLYKYILINTLRLSIIIFLTMTKEWAFLLSSAMVSIVGIGVYAKQYQKTVRKSYRYTFQIQPKIWSPMLSYSLGNYVFNTLVFLPNTIIPLIVLNRLGATLSAYFYIGWMLANMVSVFGRSFGVSLFVEGSKDYSSIGRNMLRSFVATAVVVIPGVIVLIVLAKPILMIFGKDYGTEATQLVRLLAISIIPFTVYGIAVGVLKARGKITFLILTAITYTGLHLVLSYGLVTNFGLVGIGYAVNVARFAAAFLAIGFVFLSISYRTIFQYITIPPENSMTKQ